MEWKVLRLEFSLEAPIFRAYLTAGFYNIYVGEVWNSNRAWPCVLPARVNHFIILP